MAYPSVRYISCWPILAPVRELSLFGSVIGFVAGRSALIVVSWPAVVCLKPCVTGFSKPVKE
ncbi:MAG: hypothetical protein R2857_00820 [Vampirovibrionales bacterium]